MPVAPWPVGDNHLLLASALPAALLPQLSAIPKTCPRTLLPTGRYTPARASLPSRGEVVKMDVVLVWNIRVLRTSKL